LIRGKINLFSLGHAGDDGNISRDAHSPENRQGGMTGPAG